MLSQEGNNELVRWFHRRLFIRQTYIHGECGLRGVGVEGWWRWRKRRLKVGRFLVWDLQVDVKLFSSPRHSRCRSGCAPAIHLLAVAAPAGCRETNATAALSPPRLLSSSSVRGKIALTFFTTTFSLTSVSKEAPAPFYELVTVRKRKQPVFQLLYQFQFFSLTSLESLIQFN